MKTPDQPITTTRRGALAALFGASAVAAAPEAAAKLISAGTETAQTTGGIWVQAYGVPSAARITDARAFLEAYEKLCDAETRAKLAIAQKRAIFS